MTLVGWIKMFAGWNEGGDAADITLGGSILLLPLLLPAFFPKSCWMLHFVSSIAILPMHQACCKYGVLIVIK